MSHTTLLTVATAFAITIAAGAQALTHAMQQANAPQVQRSTYTVGWSHTHGGSCRHCG